MNRIKPQVLLTVTLLLLTLQMLPERYRSWARTTRERGDTMGFVVITAGVVLMAGAIVAYLRPVVTKYLMQIQ
jgi:hypothetical protein